MVSTSIWPRLPDAPEALLRSQSGPLSGLPFTCCPTAFHRSPRRPWRPPPSSVCECVSVGSPWICLGKCRCPCMRSNVAVRDLDIGVPDRSDERRLEVVALFHGPDRGRHDSQRKDSGTLWPAKLVGGGLRSAASSCSWLYLRLGMSQRCCVPEQDKLGFTGGAPCLPAVRLVRSLCLFWKRRGGTGADGPTPSTADATHNITETEKGTQRKEDRERETREDDTRQEDNRRWKRRRRDNMKTKREDERENEREEEERDEFLWKMFQNPQTGQMSQNV